MLQRGQTASGLVAPMPGLLFPEAAHKKQMGAPDDAERFCVFGDSHRLCPADGAVEVLALMRRTKVVSNESDAAKTGRHQSIHPRCE